MALFLFWPGLSAADEKNATAINTAQLSVPSGNDVETSAGLLEEIIGKIADNDSMTNAYQSLVENPISPPDTRSPRATLGSLLLIMQAADDLWLTTRDSFFSNDSFFLTETEKENLILVKALIEKAAQTFDLSGIPAASRERASIEIVLQMQEILDRIYLPPLDAIPGNAAGTFSATDTKPLDLDKWSIPGTSLTIARQKDGPRAGDYLFTKATVERIPEDYDVIKSLPITNDRGEDLYRYYIYTPGNLVAPQWYVYILNGPDFLKETLSGQAYWQWLGLILTVVVFLFAAITYGRWNSKRSVPLDVAARQFRQVINPILLILLANLFRYICEEQINITGELLLLLTTGTAAFIWTVSAWLTYQFLQLVYLWTSRNKTLSKASLDASLLRTGFRVASFAIAIIVLGYGATRIGIPIYGVVAGLGVGGLAIALAAQPTLENFIGGLILYADGIVRVGDFFQFDDLSGTVEEIGIRSTRIRALDRTMIIISNADLVKRKIINYSRRDVFMFRHKIGLRYETSAETLKAVTEGITTMLIEHEHVLEEPLRVRIVGYGDFAILIDIYANIAASNMNSFLEFQEELLMNIRKVMDDNGAGFAFPSSTVYLARDDMPEPPPTDLSEPEETPEPSKA